MTSRSFAILLIFITYGLGAAPVRAQAPYRDDPTPPEGILGQRVDAVLKAVEIGDPERIRTLVTESFTPELQDAFPMAEHVNVFLDVHDASRGFAFHGVRSYPEGGGPSGSVVIVKNRLTEGWQAIILDLEPESPHRIRRLQFAPARPPSDLPPPPPIPAEAAVRDLEEWLTRLTLAEMFSGAVLLARDERVLYQGAFGPAYRGFDAPNRVDTKFNLGSMNKMFTATAVAQLVETGALAFEDPLSTHLDPDWLPRVDLSRVRIEHLLTHTSGLGSYFNDRYLESSRELFRSVSDYKPLVVGDTLAFEPGTRWQYSNTGYLLLGAVIERVSGEDYFDYMRRHVYEPAGMIDTDCYDMDLAVSNLAIGYDRERGPDGAVHWRNNLYSHVIRGGPAGGGFSTVVDLFRFGQALRSGALVSPAMAERLWTPVPEPDAGYGYGFGVESGPGGRRVGHTGGFPGISSSLELYIDSGYTAVVLSNLGGGSDAVSQKLQELIARIRD